MASPRRPIPNTLRDQLLEANRHTCCLCKEPRHPVEIHHINSIPSDNSPNNLAVLCRNCHGRVTTRGNLGSSFSSGEVLRYKNLWETCCKESIANDYYPPRDLCHEIKLIDGNCNEEFSFLLIEGEELIFSIIANDYLDAVISNEVDIDDWSNSEHADDHPLPNCFWHRINILEGEYKFVAPVDGSYVLLLINWDEDEVEVTFDAAVWTEDD